MNEKVIDLLERRTEKNKKLSSQPTPSSSVVRLWRMSLEMDEVIKKAVLHDKLSPDEVATILANRLSVLISCCQDPALLSEFCVDLIQRTHKTSA